MTEQTTPLDLDVITARAEAATPGPWEPIPTDPASVCSADDDGYWTRVADNVQLDADADFIAHAREDVPRLVAEVRRLTAALTEAYEARDIAQGQWRWYQARAERAESALAEVAALTRGRTVAWCEDGPDGGPAWVSVDYLRAILARTEQTGGDR